jgi:hypothetical protein
LFWLQMAWRHWLAIQVLLKVIMIIDYIWPPPLSAIFQLYLCGHVYCWRKLESLNYLYLICHTHTGYLLHRNTETRSVLLSLMLPGFISVRKVNAFTSYNFFNSHQFCCKNMNYSNLSETYVCINIEIMSYGGKLKTLITEKN